MKKATLLFPLILLGLAACGGGNSTTDSENLSIPSVSDPLSTGSISEVVSTPVSTPDSSGGDTTSTPISLPDAPVYASKDYYYDFSTFNTVVNYKAGSESFGHSGYDWDFSSYQNQGSKFYVGSNGKNGNDALFGLTRANGFFDLLEPAGYTSLETTYGFKMNFDMPTGNSVKLAWLNHNTEVDVTILYSTDSGATWSKGISQEFDLIPESGAYTLPGSLQLSQTFTGKVRYAFVFKAVTLTADGGSTLNLDRVTIA